MTLRPRAILSLPLTAAALGLLAALAPPAPAAPPTPPVSPPEVQIWPLGDSITHGFTAPRETPGGYRGFLFSALAARGYQVRSVGASTVDSSPALDAAGQSHHDGHSGFRIDQVANNLDGEDNSEVALGGEGDSGGFWLTGAPSVRAPLSPDLILLDIGANDYFTHYDPEAPGGDGWAEFQTDPSAFDDHAAARMDALIGKLIALRPGAAILVASVLPDVYNSPAVAGFNARLQARIMPKYQALGARISFVDQAAGFVDPVTGIPRADFYGADPVHPNAAGYARMASAWLRGIAAVLPPPSPVAPARARLLWRDADGRACVASMGPDSIPVDVHFYGPYPGWTATAVATGPDGATHLLWNAADGRVRLWNLSDPDPAATGFSYGPYGEGTDPRHWAASGLAVGPDGVVHLLWNHPSGRAALWALGAGGGFAITGGYGPYTEGSPDNEWRADGLAVAPDSTCRLLWNDTAGRAAVWAVDEAGAFDVLGGYGPYADAPGAAPWRATALAAAPDGALRLLWNDADGRVALWGMTASGGVASLALYGPYVEGTPDNKWSATGVCVGPDGVCGLLWGDTAGRTALWAVDKSGRFAITGGFESYLSGAAVGLSAGP